MSVNRREFLRRMVAGSALLVTGLVSAWELLQSPLVGGQQGAKTVTETQPPSTETVTEQQTITQQETVTVTQETVTSTKYASPSSSSQSQSSQQSSQSSSSSSSSATSATSSSTTSSSSSSSSSSSASQPPAGYFLAASLSQLAGKTSAYFNHPVHGTSILVNYGGQWNAFSATCTHAPCTVQFGGSTITCPCHNGKYNPSNGAVVGGPPPRPLTQYQVLVQDGNVYVSSA